MKLTSRNCLWLGLGTLVLVSLLWDRFSAQGAPDRWSALPTKGLGFSSRDLPLDATEAQIFGPAHTVKRLYQAGPQRFILTAVEGSRNRHAIHDPLYCFRGNGWQVTAERSVAVPGGQARVLRLTRSGQRTEAVFWFTDGRERQDSAGRAWWLSLRRRLTFGRSGGQPALILLQPANDQAPNWNSVFAQCPFLFDI